MDDTPERKDVIAMEYVSRSELGWPASAAPTQTDPVLGVKVHYEGTPVPVVEHSKCASRWTSIRNSHLANTAEGYSDVAYNWAVCDHGVIFEGRGLGKRAGANGSQSLNRTHYAILWMGGTSGVVTPSAKSVTAIQEVIRYLRSKGAGKDIKGHRDGYATACPGDAMYSLVKSGKLEPITAPAPSPVPQEEVMNAEQDARLKKIEAAVQILLEDRKVAPWQYKGLNETKDAYWYLRESKKLLDAIKAKLG